MTSASYTRRGSNGAKNGRKQKDNLRISDYDNGTNPEENPYSNSSLIVFLRHGQALNNVERILAGRQDNIPLTKTGVSQAKRIGSFIKPLNISAVYSSPIERANHTAQIVAKKIGVDKVHVDDRLVELEMGDFSGMSYSDLLDRHGNIFLKFYKESLEIKKNGVETFSQVKRRVMDMMDYVSKKHKNKNVLLVTHMDPIKAIITSILNLKPESLFDLEVENASLNIIKKDLETEKLNVSSINTMCPKRYNHQFKKSLELLSSSLVVRK